MINYTNNIVYSTLNVKGHSVVCWLADERRRHNYLITRLRYTQPVSQEYTPLQT